MKRSNGGYVFALVGATGAVGREALAILEERKFPIAKLRLLASDRSVGQEVEFRGESVPVETIGPGVFRGCDLAFFTAGGKISREYVPAAAGEGALVVDNTSAFRLDEGVPLAVPEVNPEVLAQIPIRRIISVPNCTTVQLVVAVAPLHRKARARRIVVSTYQSTSGAGRRAMEELSREVTDLFNYRETEPEVFPHRIAFNLIPEIGGFDSDGVSVEERKIMQETRKILGDPSIGVSATAVRVPTFRGHAEAVNLETERALSAEEAREILSRSPGVVLLDDPAGHGYPTPANVQGEDGVFVGRIRKDPSRENGLDLWVVADNLRKGAALNGVQIFEQVIRNGLI